jgi:hypothetical protein
MALLDPALLPTLCRLELGTLPPKVGEPYPSYVSAVDADGNELVGIRVPDISVPMATHTGWVPRHPSTGGDGQALDMMGTTLPFPPTPTSDDPRKSIAERYRDRDDYVARARAAARALAEQGYILEEDIDLAVDLAAARYDVLAPKLVSP